MADKPKTIIDYAARGIIAGAGLGVIASWIAPITITRGLFLGMLCGCLAGLTMFYRRGK
jgi:hypothetical protein